MKIKNLLKEIRKRVKLRTLVLLIVLLVFNSYAWFIYASKVSSSINVHVSSWDIAFEAGTGETTTNVVFNVQRAYPGMETYSETITARNRGETVAVLTYEITSIKIFGNTYTVDENTTLEDLNNMIENDFPFQINIVSSSENLAATNGEATITISFEWAFESGNDLLDTNWGEQAYTYYATHPGETSIQVNLNLTAQQQT